MDLCRSPPCMDVQQRRSATLKAPLRLPHLAMFENLCIGVIGGTPVTALQRQLRQPRAPHRAGITASRNKLHLTTSGDQCVTVAAAAGITLAIFYASDPAVGTTYVALWRQSYVCTGVMAAIPSRAFQLTPATAPQLPHPCRQGPRIVKKKSHLIFSAASASTSPPRLV